LQDLLNTTPVILLVGAVIGFVGMVLGIVLVRTTGHAPVAKTNFAHSKIASRNHAMRAVLALDDFVGACYAAVEDMPEFNPTDPGDFLLHTDEPSLVWPADVDWTTLGPDLADDLMWFPNRVRNVMDALESLDITPPTFSNFFEHRREEFSRLGLRALALIDKLTNAYNLEQLERPAYYRPKELFNAKLALAAAFWARRNRSISTDEETNITRLFPASRAVPSQSPDRDPL
jgi:hypothetical protein